MIYSLSKVQAFNPTLRPFKVLYVTVRSDYLGTVFKGQESWWMVTVSRFESWGLGVSFPVLCILLVKGSKDASWLIENSGELKRVSKHTGKAPRACNALRKEASYTHEKIEVNAAYRQLHD